MTRRSDVAVTVSLYGHLPLYGPRHGLRGGGGGGGFHPDYFVKLDFEIAVDQQTRARDRTFEGVPDSG